MVLKFFKATKLNPEPGGLDYILKNPTARVLRGNVEILRAVIAASPANLSQRFTAGVLNDTAELDSAILTLLLDELEFHLLAGRLKESMVWCAIAHSDKGKFEIHIVIALYDLLFRKIVHPYVDRIDRIRYSAWMEQCNLVHGLKSPVHCLRIEPDYSHLRIAKEDVGFLRSVWLKVHDWVKEPGIKNRSTLKLFLQESGYQVRCDNRWCGPLDQPVILSPGGKSLKLTGSTYYRPDFGLPSAIPLDLNDTEAVRKRLAELQKTISARMDFRHYWTIGRLFGKAEQKLVARGKARERLRQLNAEKLRSTRVADRARRWDFRLLAHLSRQLESGIQPEMLIGNRSKKPKSAKLIALPEQATSGIPVDAANASEQVSVAQPQRPDPKHAQADPPTPTLPPPESIPKVVGETTVENEVETSEPPVLPARPAAPTSDSDGGRSESPPSLELNQTQPVGEPGQMASSDKKSAPPKKLQNTKEIDDSPEI